MHPWAPPRVLRWKYGIAKHDVDNWLRSNPNARQVIDRSTWRLTLDQSTTNIRAILARAWEYYVVEELQIDLDADDVVERLIRIKTPQKPFGFWSTVATCSDSPATRTGLRMDLHASHSLSVTFGRADRSLTTGIFSLRSSFRPNELRSVDRMPLAS